MRLVKPSFVHHNGNPIFTIDIHPDGTRFATGGLGNDAGLVIIWNLMSVIDEKFENNNNIPKILCQLDNHLACVNCVRWSANGKTLATGGDEKTIMLWNRSFTAPSSVFGSSGQQKCVENWRTTTTLRGHSGDILDVAWSPQDRYLASSSVDNTIIIWCMKNFQSVTTLRGHSGLVKGVSWDPVGAFLASQSDDRTVRVWRTKDWTCEKVINEPFEDCGGTTHVLRLSWSPDGLYLVSAHAMNGGGPTAQIIERKGWKCDKDFVGHRKAVNCVRFNPSILEQKDKDKKKQYCCLAIGSRDRCVSVWCTTYQRPLAVVHELFNDSILDLSWCQIKDQTVLLACSTDGTIACIMLSEDELGKPLSAEDKNSVFQREYGKSIDLISEESWADMGIIPEYSELLDIEEKKSANTVTNNNKYNYITNMGPPVSKSTSTKIDVEKIPIPISTKSVAMSQKPTPAPANPAPKQVETRREDGRRRITPMFVPLNVEPVSHQAPSAIVSTSAISNEELEKKMDQQMLRGNIDEASTSSVGTDSTESPANSPHSNVGNKENSPDNSNQSNSADNSNNSNAGTSQNTSNAADNSNKSNPGPSQNQSNRPDNLNNADPGTSQNQSDTGTINKNILRVAPDKAAVTFEPQYSEPVADDANPLKQVTFTNTDAGKAVPYTQPQFKICGQYQVTIMNNFTSTTAGPLSKVTGTKSSKTLWEMLIGSPVVKFELCAKYVLVCSINGTIRFLNTETGTPLLPILHMPSPVIQAVFSTNCDYGGVVTVCGKIRVWNLTIGSIFISTTCHDLYTMPVTTPTPIVSFFHVTEVGILYIMLSNGSAFAYNKELESWIALHNHDLIIRYGLQQIHQNSTKTFQKYPLCYMQTTTQQKQGNLPAMQIVRQPWKHKARQNFIENQIETCKMLKSADELQYWYNELGIVLSKHGEESIIRAHLDDLLGPPNNLIADGDDEKPIKETILGIEKHTLLKNMLEHFQTQTKWHRIYMEYSEQIQD